VCASLVRILVVIGISAGAGYFRARDLPWVPDTQALQAKEDLHEVLRTTHNITLERFLTLIQEGAVVIDARSAEAYAEGHLAIDCEPPVLNVPADEIDAHVTRLMDLQGLPVVLYCTSESCDYAEELYAALQQFGFVDIWIYFPGWEGIVEAGLKTATGPDTWRGFYPEPNVPVEDDYDADLGDAVPDPNLPSEIKP
jgi:rhodanese-related sulfurtransferase